MDPVPYIQKLQYELMAKEIQLSCYYEKNYSVIFQIFNSLTVDRLIERFKPIRELSFLSTGAMSTYLSFCLINRSCINFVAAKEEMIAVLGIQHIDGIMELQERRNSMKLSDFGFGLSEPGRVAILDMVYERGEATCKDLEKAFSFSGSTAYHHLSILVKCGILKTRTDAKTIFYSVNEKAIHAWIHTLNRYTKKKISNGNSQLLKQ